MARMYYRISLIRISHHVLVSSQKTAILSREDERHKRNKRTIADICRDDF